MADKIYVGDIGVTVNVATGLDLTTAETTTLLVRQPDGTEVEWAAAVDGDATDGNLTYTTVDGDLPRRGAYKLQAYVVLSSGEIFYGETANFHVYNEYE